MRDKIYMQYNPWWEEEYRHEGFIPKVFVPGKLTAAAKAKFKIL